MAPVTVSRLTLLKKNPTINTCFVCAEQTHRKRVIISTVGVVAQQNANGTKAARFLLLRWWKEIVLFCCFVFFFLHQLNKSTLCSSFLSTNCLGCVSFLSEPSLPPPRIHHVGPGLLSHVLRQTGLTAGGGGERYKEWRRKSEKKGWDSWVSSSQHASQNPFQSFPRELLGSQCFISGQTAHVAGIKGLFQSWRESYCVFTVFVLSELEFILMRFHFQITHSTKIQTIERQCSRSRLSYLPLETEPSEEQ